PGQAGLLRITPQFGKEQLGHPAPSNRRQRSDRRYPAARFSTARKGPEWKTAGIPAFSSDQIHIRTTPQAAQESPQCRLSLDNDGNHDPSLQRYQFPQPASPRRSGAELGSFVGSDRRSSASSW